MRPHHLATLALLAALTAGSGGCADRPDAAGPNAPPDGGGRPAITAAPAPPPAGAGRLAQERLARRLALALAEPQFRHAVRDALDRSTVREHKLQFQRFLSAPEHHALAALAQASGETPAAVEDDARRTIPLEFYLPVPAHRAGWRGGDDVLVATARADREPPVAFDLQGRRRRLSADVPPAAPVIALVPVETDFDGPSVGLMLPEDGGGGGGGSTGGTGTTTVTPGLYMTATHFIQDFEGWLKGSPEFEIHILGQLGASDSLTSYQCAGEHSVGSYIFDQNALDWTGNVLLFSSTQLSAYKSNHPNQNVRVLALEDDDGACQIKLDGERFKTLQATLQTQYPNLTGGKDSTTSTLARLFKRANSLQKILRSAYSWITSQDDLVGNAIEDAVVGEYHSGFNWIVRGDDNVTNGWLKLQMR
jgi:hypothetical protein